MDSNKKIKKAYIYAITSITLLIIALIVNYFKVYLFGIGEDYTPNLFSLNMLFFLLPLLVSFILGIASLWSILYNWKSWKGLTNRGLLLVLSLPTILYYLVIATLIFST